LCKKESAKICNRLKREGSETRSLSTIELFLLNQQFTTSTLGNPNRFEGIADFSVEP
jgi:hypothetical protein